MNIGRLISTASNNIFVTVADYITKEIYVDREHPGQIINGNDKRFHHFLKNKRIYAVDIGAEGDLILEICGDE